ncbi:hypothetical protein BN2497_10735 [Janthinobacterium sp. CG23_2]|nr:hypothetical protein BN2497_10735 [Janthinobacterium sp. CG23_2]CUU31765.1 hypothetical protein BN3177_10735 [Janthinobacterium sp. CG23_2]
MYHMGPPLMRLTATPAVIPAQAGIQGQPLSHQSLDSRLRGNDGSIAPGSAPACTRPRGCYLLIDVP